MMHPRKGEVKNLGEERVLIQILIHYREMALKQYRDGSNVDIPNSMLLYLQE
jgi:hypothetical protein